MPFSLIHNPVSDLFSLMPDSILFGSMVLYVLTQNISYGMLAIFLLEVVLSHRILTWFFYGVSGSPGSQPMTADSVKCRAGYKPAQYAVNRMFRPSYPSYGLYSMSAIAMYLALSMSEFSDTLAEMGEDWTSRTVVAYVCIGCIFVFYLLWRMGGCDDNLGEVGLALFFGTVIGYLGLKAHKAMFGPESINFLGLPYLKDKKSDGHPIYICSSNPA